MQERSTQTQGTATATINRTQYGGCPTRGSLETLWLHYKRIKKARRVGKMKIEVLANLYVCFFYLSKYFSVPRGRGQSRRSALRGTLPLLDDGVHLRQFRGDLHKPPEFCALGWSPHERAGSRKRGSVGVRSAFPLKPGCRSDIRFSRRKLRDSRAILRTYAATNVWVLARKGHV